MADCSIAVIGATGAVGRVMLSELAELLPECANVTAFASSRSAGQQVAFGDCELTVKVWDSSELGRHAIVLMSAGSAFSQTYAPEIAASGAVVIDNSSAWRMDSRVPLVVPSINGAVVDGMTQGIIANPNCSTIQLVLTLNPLKPYGLREVHVCTYQAVSGAGQRGVDQLQQELAGVTTTNPSPLRASIAHNVVAAIGDIDSEGNCEEEVKIRRETKRILSCPTLGVAATTVRVPVYNCHCEAVTVKLTEGLSAVQANAIFAACEDLTVVQGHDVAKLPAPRDSDGCRKVAVARVRQNIDMPETLQYWNVADNLRVGAATNAVLIAKRIVANHAQLSAVSKPCLQQGETRAITL